jgi:tRNA uridine 5-carbamoylmethylation protein Kti12
VVFDASLEVCLERNALRIGTPRFVPETVIRDMFSKFERPGMVLPSINGAQHRWEVATTVSSDIDLMDAINVVRAGWKSFMSQQCKLREEQRERDKKRDADAHTTANSLLHQLELRLRGVLSDVLKTHRSDGARLSKLKQQFVTTMKQQLPDADVSNPAQWLSDQEEAFRKLIL